MRPVYVSGVCAYVPPRRITIEEAVAEGRYEEARARTDGFTAIAVEDTLDVAAMAMRAAAPLIGEADRDRVGSLYFTAIHRHGHTHLWPPANHLQKMLRLSSAARVLGVSHGCNGAFLAASLAIDLIGAGQAEDHLVVGADKFSGSGFDRFDSDLGTLYGDAASAIRFSPAPGPMRVAGFALESEPQLEEMYRAPEPGPEGPGDHRIKEAKRAFLDRVGRPHFDGLFRGALQRLRTRLLAQVALDESPADFIVYPNVGAGLSAALYAGELGDLAREDVWAYGRSVGHTGVSDQFVGLCHLVEQGRLRAGSRVLLLGAGNGLSLAALVLDCR
ncbi:ketoacyl-ACP synthase III family protein [Salinarimonas sp.]|uniref:ketoacyl-ACP synthase III family protein n=1 Tax=Salinarimonas sp. TaxID=2766526 RepID=UPI0032D9770E